MVSGRPLITRRDAVRRAPWCQGLGGGADERRELGPALPVRRPAGQRDRGPLAGAVGAAGGLPRGQPGRRPGRRGATGGARLRARHVPLPLGRGAARRAPARVHRHGRLRALPADAGRQRALHDGLRRLRAPGRAVRRTDRRAPAGHHRAQHRPLPGPAATPRPVPRHPPHAVDGRPRLLPLDAVGVPAAARRLVRPGPRRRPAGRRAGGRVGVRRAAGARRSAVGRAVPSRARGPAVLLPAGLPQEGARQLVPRAGHGAGQRGGHRRRPLRARQLPGGPARPRAVGHADHRLRRPAARRPRPRRLARVGQAPAAQLDRPLLGRPAAVRRRRAPGRGRRGLHDAAGDRLRRDVRRAVTRAPARRGGGDRDAGGQPGDRRARADPGRRLRRGRLRHRSGDGRAGPRPARLRVRTRVRPAAALRGRPRRRARHRRGDLDGGLDRQGRRDGRRGRERAGLLRDGGRGRRGRRRGVARGAVGRRARGVLPAAGLAVQPAALLGRAVPGRLRPRRRRARAAGLDAARAPARGRRLRPARLRPGRPHQRAGDAAVAAAGLGGGRARPRRRAADLHARDQHDAQLGGQLLVRAALPRPARPRGRRRPGQRGLLARPLRAEARGRRRPLRRRRRADRAAPALRPVLAQGPARPGPPQLLRAVPPPGQPGHGPGVGLPRRARLPGARRGGRRGR